VTTASSETVLAGNVISQNPAAGGANVRAGHGGGPGGVAGCAPVAVPNVVGLTQAAATTAIGAANLTLGTVTTAYDEMCWRAT
jgi:beta-lactam-binding protein with PASTA domain